MKYIIISVLLLATMVACEDEGQKHFNAESLDELNLANIDVFWESTLDIDSVKTNGETFIHSDGYVDCIRYYQAGRYVCVTVFESQNDAITAVQVLKTGIIACIIEDGTSNDIEDTWWYSKCAPNMVFLNKLNTIIQIGFASNATYEAIEPLMLETATEIASSVLKYSDSI